MNETQIMFAKLLRDQGGCNSYKFFLHFPPPELFGIKLKFSELDINQNGFIDPEEFDNDLQF